MGTGLFSSFVGVGCVLIISLLYALLFGKKSEVRWRTRIWGVVSFVYLLSALIVSHCFNTVNYFMMSDPCNYIANAASSSSFDFDVAGTLIKCYIQLGDNNGLYNLMISSVGAFYNTSCDGVNSFNLSLISVVFGIMSAVTLFRVLAVYFPEKKAYKYTLTFSLLSLFHFYSVVIVRDICVAFFYLLCFEVVQKRFSIKGLLLLVLYMLLAWGVRLYSGLFAVAFILYYVYSVISNRKIKYIVIPLFAGILIYALFSISFVVEQSIAEINLANEDTLDRGGGLVMKLLTLPPVIKQVAMLFFTQIAPFPPTGFLFTASRIPEVYMSLMVIIYEFWWYLIAYTVFYVLLVKGFVKRIDFTDLLLLGIAVALIIATSSHPDIRRMMPVYPIIYYEYLKLRSTTFSPHWYRITRNNLTYVYIGLLLVYMVLKF